MQHTSLLLHFNLNLTCFNIDYQHTLSSTLGYFHVQHVYKDIFITFMSLFNNQHINNDRNENYLLKDLEIKLKSTNNHYYNGTSNPTLPHQKPTS